MHGNNLAEAVVAVVIDEIRCALDGGSHLRAVSVGVVLIIERNGWPADAVRSKLSNSKIPNLFIHPRFGVTFVRPSNTLLYSRHDPADP